MPRKANEISENISENISGTAAGVVIGTGVGSLKGVAKAAAPHVEAGAITLLGWGATLLVHGKKAMAKVEAKLNEGAPKVQQPKQSFADALKAAKARVRSTEPIDAESTVVTEATVIDVPFEETKA